MASADKERNLSLQRHHTFYTSTVTTRLPTTLHYTTLHYNTLHCTALHHTTQGTEVPISVSSAQMSSLRPILAWKRRQTNEVRLDKGSLAPCPPPTSGLHLTTHPICFVVLLTSQAPSSDPPRTSASRLLILALNMTSRPWLITPRGGCSATHAALPPWTLQPHAPPTTSHTAPGISHEGLVCPSCSPPPFPPIVPRPTDEPRVVVV